MVDHEGNGLDQVPVKHPPDIWGYADETFIETLPRISRCLTP
jgi:hypothetical protein